MKGLRGNNTITLNEATMEVAIQEFLDSRVKEAGSRVTRIVPIKENPSGWLFEIHLTEIPAEKEDV